MKKLSGILPLFIVIVIDGMGFGMTIPVLAPLITKTSASLLGAHTSPESRHLLFGFLMLIRPLAYFFGAPLLGLLSDKYGRKRLLTYCLSGTFLSFVLYVISFANANLALLIIARIVGGFTTGSQAIAQAAMVDISEKNKALNIGSIALAMTIGLIAGPLIGGILSNPGYLSFFNNTTPFYFSALLAAFNLVFLWRFFHDPHKPQPTKQLSKHCIKQILVFIRQPALRQLLLTFFCFELAWSLYYQGMAVIGVQKFHLSRVNVGYLSAYIGLSLSVGLLFVLRLVVRYFSLKQIIRLSLWLASGCFIIGFLATDLSLQLLLAIPITFAIATGYCSLITAMSDLTLAPEQGLLMGTTDAVLSLAFAITGFLSGWLTLHHPMLPLLASALFMGAGLILYKKTKQRLLFEQTK
jgi:MFS transporter, DHA1 family, tetracycline resistance protein